MALEGELSIKPRSEVLVVLHPEDTNFRSDEREAVGAGPPKEHGFGFVKVQLKTQLLALAVKEWRL